MDTRSNIRSNRRTGSAVTDPDWDDTKNETDMIDETNDSLKRELSALNIYEPNMSTEDMQNILRAIKISKVEQNISSQKVDDTGDEDVIPSSQSFEFNNQASAAFGSAKALRKSATPEFGSPRSHLVKATPGTSMNDGSIASELFDQMVTGENEKKIVKNPAMMSPNSDRESGPILRRNPVATEAKPNLKNLGMRMSRHLIDPFDCSHPASNFLPKSANFPTQRPQFKIVDDEIIIPEHLVAKRAALLKQHAYLWTQQNYNRSSKEFRWGPPVKVGTRNGSLQKSIKVEQSADQAEESDDDNVFDTKSRMIARDRQPGLRQILPKKNSDVYEYNEEDIDEEYNPDATKRKKGKGTRKTPTGKRATGERNTKKNAKKSIADADENQITMDNFIDDSEAPTTSRKRSKSPEYPDYTPSQRKKQATGRGRGRTLGPRKRDPLPVTRTTTIPVLPEMTESEAHRSRPHGLNDNEISAMLTDDEDEPAKKSDSPAGLPSARLQRGITHVQQVTANKREAEEAYQIEQAMLAEQKKENMAEIVRQRILTAQSRQAANELAAAKKKEKEEIYQSLSIGSQGPCSSNRHRTELISDAGPRRAILLTDEQAKLAHRPKSAKVQGMMAVGSEKNIERVECPLCGKSFPPEEIEEHANNCCDSAEMIVSTPNRRHPARSEDLRCKVCSRFVAEDMLVLEKHKKACVKRMTGEDWE